MTTNNGDRIVPKNHNNGWLAAFATIFATMILAGCGWQGAYIRHNWEVQDQFDAYQLYPGCRYFTSGTLRDPRGVLALKPEYKLNSDGWMPVAMTGGLLAQWLSALKKGTFVEYNTFSNGAQIVDDQGNIAGYYYSVWDFPRIRFSQPKELMIHKPFAQYRFDNNRAELLSDDDQWPR